MDMVNSMIWLAAWVMIGWFANRIASAQTMHRAEKPELLSDDLSVLGKISERSAAPILSALPNMPEESFKQQFFASDSLGE